MKKVQIILTVICLLISAACIFYVAVGAAATPPEDETVTVPDYILKERAYFEERTQRDEKLLSLAPAFYDLSDSPVSFSLYSNHYGLSWKQYKVNYTFSDVRLTDTVPASIDPARLDSIEGIYENGKLSEGYTFLCVDVIIESESDEKEMFLMNMMKLSDGGNGTDILGFAGQKYENTALFHIDLMPNVPFRTTVIFAVEKDGYLPPICVNPQGSGAIDGSCAFVDHGLGN